MPLWKEQWNGLRVLIIDLYRLGLVPISLKLHIVLEYSFIFRDKVVWISAWSYHFYIYVLILHFATVLRDEAKRLQLSYTQHSRLTTV